MSITLFSWGYYGWGNHTPQLVKAVDAAETGRGFEPPIFVDIRIRRSVRAAGFTGPAFEKLLGSKRHRWMKSLGNKFIETRTGPTIQIAKPQAAEELLDLAVELGKTKQRLLFFCSCQWPKCDGEIACHRCTVTGLVLAAANRRKVPVEVVEWPGGEPKRIDLDVSTKDFSAIRTGRKSVPLSSSVELAEVAALPWCSVATLHADGKTLHRIVGPAARQGDGWVLPVFDTALDSDAKLEAYTREAAKMRRAFGLNTAVD
jgi:hypothetical protein